MSRSSSLLNTWNVIDSSKKAGDSGGNEEKDKCDDGEDGCNDGVAANLKFNRKYS